MSKNFFANPFIIGAIFFILCVVFEIHGSSINIYADILNHPELNGEIFGHWRFIRSDEYNVFTPFAFSQYFTNFSMISDIVRAVPTNMFIVYGQAVWHPALIYRPAQIGYLFLDQGSALAFFWMGRLIALFIVSFKFAEKVLRVDKKLSLIYAVMVTFSPLAQWWWSVNSIAEILAAGQGVALCWKIYLENENKFSRFLYAILFLWCAGIFIFGIYPAWQVSFGYVFLFLLIAVSLENSKSIKILWRDKIFWLLGFLIMLAPIAHALYVSQDMIATAMATEYPGQRLNLGGKYSPLVWLIYPATIFSPFTDELNACGRATFFSMAPLGLIIFFYVNFKLKRIDFLMCTLTVIIILLSLWTWFQMPEILAKFTLMGQTIPERVRPAIDFAQMILMFRGLTLIDIRNKVFLKLFVAAIISLITILVISLIVPAWINFDEAVGIFAFTSVSVFLLLTPLTKIRTVILIVMMLTIGATVNPVAKGVDTILEMPVGKKIAEIACQENSKWLSVDAPISFAIMYGAPSINCCNIYPAFENWSKLDPDGENFKIYNRYAHIFAKLTDAPTTFSLVNVDVFEISLNPNDLLKLNVTHIFSQNADLEKFSLPSVSIRKIYEDNGNFIYKVN